MPAFLDADVLLAKQKFARPRPPEVKLSAREDMVTPLNCRVKVKGGFVVATVGKVKQPTERKLIFRVKYKTMDGARQHLRRLAGGGHAATISEQKT